MLVAARCRREKVEMTAEKWERISSDLYKGAAGNERLARVMTVRYDGRL